MLRPWIDEDVRMTLAVGNRASICLGNVAVPEARILQECVQLRIGEQSRDGHWTGQRQAAAIPILAEPAAVSALCRGYKLIRLSAPTLTTTIPLGRQWLTPRDGHDY